MVNSRKFLHPSSSFFVYTKTFATAKKAQKMKVNFTRDVHNRKYVFYEYIHPVPAYAARFKQLVLKTKNLT